MNCAYVLNPRFMPSAPCDLACPACGIRQSQVRDTRANTAGSQIRRRRTCLGCAARYSTYETLTPPSEYQAGRVEREKLESLLRGMLERLAVIGEEHPLPSSAEDIK